MFKKIFALTSLFLINLILIFPNPGFSSNVMWTKIYGGTYKEQAISVQQKSDSGYMIVGSIFANNKYSAWLIKTNAFGDTLWTNRYGNGQFLWTPLVQSTSDGGYIIVGSILYEEKTIVLVIKTDESGKTLWTKKYEEGEINWILQIRQTLKEGYIMGGFTQSGKSYENAWIIKTNVLGDILWTKTFHADYYDAKAKSILQTEDGGYLVGVDIDEHIALFKINSAGDSLWRKNYIDSDYDISSIKFFKQLSDGNFLIAGTIEELMGLRYIWFIKTDVNGDTLWTKTFYKTSIYNTSISVQQTIEGGFIILADVDSRNFPEGNWIIKTDPSGDTLWTKYLFQRPCGFDPIGKVESILPISDGNYILTGYWREWPESSPSDTMYSILMLTGNFGNILWETRYAVNQFNNIMSCQQTSDGGFILVGVTSTDKTNTDILIIKTDASGNTEPPITNIMGNRCSTVSDSYKLFQNFPNPFNSSTEIKYSIPQNNSFQHVLIRIYDISGRLVTTLVNRNRAAGNYSVSWAGKDWNGNSVSSGVYFYTIQADKFKTTNKMLLIR